MQTKKYVHEVKEVRDFLIANSLKYEHNEVFKALVDRYKKQFRTELKTRKEEKEQMKLVCELSKLVARARKSIINDYILKGRSDRSLWNVQSSSFAVRIIVKESCNGGEE